MNKIMQIDLTIRNSGTAFAKSTSHNKLTVSVQYCTVPVGMSMLKQVSRLCDTVLSCTDTVLVLYCGCTSTVLWPLQNKTGQDSVVW